MSLSIALDQIQRPTWWGFQTNTKPKPASGAFKPMQQVAERRAKIVAHLEANTGRITTDDLMALTGDTRSQVNKTMQDILNEGLVEKGAAKIGGNKHSTWKLVTAKARSGNE